MATPATASRAYVSFTNDLHQALERILNRYQAESNDVLRGTFTRAMEIIALRYGLLDSSDLMTAKSRNALRSIEQELEREFQSATHAVSRLLISMSRSAYILSIVGSSEAIGRAVNKTASYHVNQQDVLKNAMTARDGKHVSNRITLIFDRLRRKIMNAVELSVIQGESVKEMLTRVQSALPPKRLVKRPKRVLKPIEVKEADRPIMRDALPRFSQGFVSDEEWEAIVEDYKTDYVPQYRSPETVFDLPDPEGGPELEERYGWELEQELTDKFVRDVTSGKGLAGEQAKALGITDFVWIAVVDDKTDECCAWRDGLTSTEIAGELKSKHRDDDCQVTVPPAHFNCRCTLAPMLKDWPEVEPSNLQGFEDWLND